MQLPMTGWSLGIARLIRQHEQLRHATLGSNSGMSCWSLAITSNQKSALSPSTVDPHVVAGGDLRGCHR